MKYFSCSSVTSLPHLFIELLLPSKTGLFFSFLPLINFGRTLRRSRSNSLAQNWMHSFFNIFSSFCSSFFQSIFERGKMYSWLPSTGSQPLLSRYYCKISCRIILKKFFWRRCISWRQKVSKANCRVVLYCTVIRYNFVWISQWRGVVCFSSSLPLQGDDGNEPQWLTDSCSAASKPPYQSETLNVFSKIKIKKLKRFEAVNLAPRQQIDFYNKKKEIII